VFFDVGETLVDEERWWRELCVRAGLQPHVVWAALGVTIERGEEHDALWTYLGVEKPEDSWQGMDAYSDLYPDAVPCLEAVRDLGLRVGIAGNQSEELERWARDAQLPADMIASSANLGARKPERAFFERVVQRVGCPPAEVVYVGDRVDNDVVPALKAGLGALHVRRGPWGRLQATPAGVPAIESLTELPEALASLTR
jgi:HAD superfamily hydrolase (TIGR01662 family)